VIAWSVKVVIAGKVLQRKRKLISSFFLGKKRSKKPKALTAVAKMQRQLE